MEAETLNDGVNPSWEPTRERCWDELSDIDKAARIAKRLLGPPKLETGTYQHIHAAENMWTGDIVVVDKENNARKWNGIGIPSGIAISPLGKGCFGCIQIKS